MSNANLIEIFCQIATVERNYERPNFHFSCIESSLFDLLELSIPKLGYCFFFYLLLCKQTEKLLYSVFGDYFGIFKRIGQVMFCIRLAK